MSPKLMENMFSVFQDVYLPILSNPKNQEARHAALHTHTHTKPCSRRALSDRGTRSQGWPEVMSREVLELFHLQRGKGHPRQGRSREDVLY